MNHSADDYVGMLGGLMPQGPAWPTESDSATQLRLAGFAQEFARLDARTLQLIEECDPRTTLELLPDLERVVGFLPCQSGPAGTLAERRQQLVAKLTGLGGQTPQFYINLAAALGFTITITEFRPFTVSSHVNDPLYNAPWAYAWQVNAQLNTIRRFTVSSGVNEALSTWGNSILECLINFTKPAHTIVLFSYS